MNKQNKLLILNLLVSIFLFVIVFYSFKSKSGGDIAIIVGNIFIGFIQIITNILFRTKQTLKIILLVIFLQIFELLLFIQLGYKINEMLKI